MKYSILIKDSKDPKIFRFLTVKEEIMEEIKTETTDDSTGEVKENITYKGTGEFHTVRYIEEDKQAFEEKYLEMLNTYSRSQLLPVSLETYMLDMIFDSDKENTV